MGVGDGKLHGGYAATLGPRATPEDDDKKHSGFPGYGGRTVGDGNNPIAWDDGVGFNDADGVLSANHLGCTSGLNPRTSTFAGDPVGIWIQCRVLWKLRNTMLETNATLTRVKDLQERTDLLRGYL